MQGLGGGGGCRGYTLCNLWVFHSSVARGRGEGAPARLRTACTSTLFQSPHIFLRPTSFRSASLSASPFPSDLCQIEIKALYTPKKLYERRERREFSSCSSFAFFWHAAPPLPRGIRLLFLVDGLEERLLSVGVPGGGERSRIFPFFYLLSIVKPTSLGSKKGPLVVVTCPSSSPHSFPYATDCKERQSKFLGDPPPTSLLRRLPKIPWLVSRSVCLFRVGIVSFCHCATRKNHRNDEVGFFFSRIPFLLLRPRFPFLLP